MQLVSNTGRLATRRSLWAIPTAQTISQLKKSGDLRFAQVILGIGQGPVTWTPIQAANAYATIARHGVIRDATLVVDDPRGSRPQRTGDLHLNSNLCTTALEGLRQSVMEKLKKHGKGIVLLHDFQHATAEAAMDLLNDLKAGGYKIVFMQPKFAVTTIAAYDETILKQVKGSGGGDARPTSSVVRTISE